MALLDTVPGLNDVKDLAQKVQAGEKEAGKVMHIIRMTTAPDDGTPRTCWVKSHYRGIGKLPSDGLSC